MRSQPDATHSPQLRSWVAAANVPDTDFPIQNLPFGVMQRSRLEPPRLGVAIGDQIVDLSAWVQQGLLHDLPEKLKVACVADSLNPLMSLGRWASSALRRRLSHLLAVDSPLAHSAALLPMSAVTLHCPAQIGNYTDFYASIYHATNVGRLFRPEQPLLPNYKHVPIAYHGRASSIVVSGTSIYRPSGQRRPVTPGEGPTFGPSQRLDYEAEVGFLIGPGNRLGQPIPAWKAEQHLFGLCLVNDWSARDLQAWEYQPLGPFLGKSFATSLSPWVVTTDALIPFRCEALTRPPGDPPPLAYLLPAGDAIDLTIEVWLQSAQMQQQGIDPMLLSQAALAALYWTPTQMIAHHTSNGCNLQPGDLLASGTVSGAEPSSWGSLLELSQQGKQAITLPTGEQRKFLADGDRVTLRGYCKAPGAVRIGLGNCSSQIVPIAKRAAAIAI
ncbi:MAG: fumarylacetoacetase [Leptolyngbya sp. SIO4C1]|nr:fumarylacetoacetase [Leptolyngbya sp. SIO4C1]